MLGVFVLQNSPSAGRKRVEARPPSIPRGCEIAKISPEIQAMRLLEFADSRAPVASGRAKRRRRRFRATERAEQPALARPPHAACDTASAAAKTGAAGRPGAELPSVLSARARDSANGVEHRPHSGEPTLRDPQRPRADFGWAAGRLSAGPRVRRRPQYPGRARHGRYRAPREWGDAVSGQRSWSARRSKVSDREPLWDATSCPVG